MMAMYVTDKTRTDLQVGVSLLKVTINSSKPCVLELNNKETNSYQAGKSSRYVIHDIQVSPPAKVYTIQMQAAFDGTTYSNIFDPIVRTGAETTILTGCFSKDILCQYPVKIGITTSSGTDIELYVNLILKEGYTTTA